MSDSQLIYCWCDSPVGRLLLVADARRLRILSFASGCGRVTPEPNWRHDAERCSPILNNAARQLDEYFAGARTEFELPLAMDGSHFQQAVWRALTDIPFGETKSYGAVAEAIGETVVASRAVGVANAQNPIAIIVPCHRVNGADGSLTGFGGGLERKEILLAHERRVRPLPGQQLGLFEAV